MYLLLLIEILGLLIEAVLYGIYIVAFTITLYLLLRKRPRNTPLVIVTVLMFCLSTAHLILFAYSLLRHVHGGAIDESLEFRDPTYPEGPLQTLLECLNGILGGSIRVIAWRAWVLWNQRKFALIVPVILLTGTLSSAIGLCQCHAIAVSPSSQTFGQTILEPHSALPWGISMLSLTFITNLWAATLIALRFWGHYRETATILGRAHARSYRTILTFLIESGALYCGTLIVLLGTFVSDSNGQFVVFVMFAQFTGIYPTLIVVLVCLQLTQRDDMDRLERMTISLSHGTRSHQVGISFAPVDPTTSNDPCYPSEMQERIGHGKDVVVAP